MRWWADRDAATRMLGVVDGSDVVQGVATAALGYHGLCREALRPLAGETLVDQALVGQVLSSVDLAPVCKALAEATRPVMGAAADRYGELLAGAIHEDAAAATGRLLETWTQGGLSWPVALERAAEVHGVPLRGLGRYAHAMRAPVVPAAARDDQADRALLVWARQVGEREADGVVSKAHQFSENDVRRDEEGRFAPKNAVLSDPRSPRSQRLARSGRAARQRRRVDARVAREDREREAARPSLSGLMALLVPQRRQERAPAERVQVRRVADRRVMARAAQVRSANRVLEAKVAAAAPPAEVRTPPRRGSVAERIDDLDYAGRFADRMGHRYNDQAVYVPLTLEEARQFTKTNRLSVAAAEKVWGHELRGYTRESLGRMLLEGGDRERVSDMVILELDAGAWVTDESPEHDDGGQLAPGMLLESYLPPDFLSESGGNAYTSSFVLELSDDPDEESEEAAIPIIGVTDSDLSTVQSMRMHRSAAWNSHWSGLDVFRGSGSETGSEWRGGKAWDEAKARRDALGRFTRRTAGRVEHFDRELAIPKGMYVARVNGRALSPEESARMLPDRVLRAAGAVKFYDSGSAVVNLHDGSQLELLPVSKAWDESEVRRDEGGRFTLESGGTGDPRAVRAARAARARRRRRSALVVGVVPAEVREQVREERGRASLRDVAREASARRDARDVSARLLVQPKEQRREGVRVPRERRGPTISRFGPGGDRGAPIRSVARDAQDRASSQQIHNDESKYETWPSRLPTDRRTLDRMHALASEAWSNGMVDQLEIEREMATFLGEEEVVRHLTRRIRARDELRARNARAGWTTNQAEVRRRSEEYARKLAAFRARRDEIL